MSIGIGPTRWFLNNMWFFPFLSLSLNAAACTGQIRILSVFLLLLLPSIGGEKASKRHSILFLEKKITIISELV